MQVDYQNHRAKAKLEREYYKEQCGGEVPHFTFDFAQSIHLPFFLRQPGSYYFKIGLVVRIFGVACETEKKQKNYLIPEGAYPCVDRKGGKGCNFVISLLHHFFETYTSDIDISTMTLHADSCGGQNKNQFVFYYLIWRVICGLNDSIELSFMVPGHTKCVADQNFGHLKRKFMKNDVFSLEDLTKIVNESSYGNSAHNCQLEAPPYYNWKQFLHQFFTRKGVPKIKTDVQGLLVQKTPDGVEVLLKKHCSDRGTKWLDFLHEKPDESNSLKNLLEAITQKNNLENYSERATPISDARNYYLYNDIAQKFFNEKNSEADEDEDESEDEEEDNSEEIKASFFGIKTPGEWLAFKKQMQNFKSGGKSKPAGRKGTKRRINEDEDVEDGLVAIV